MRRYKESKYIVSSSGVIINENSGRKLKDHSNGRGYRKTTLTISGKQVQRYVHRLVAELYVENPNNLNQVNHKDGDKSNNHYSNLEWVTSLANVTHAIKNGFFPKSTEYWNSKLTELDILEIFRLKKEGWKQYVIAKKFSVSKSTISEVVNRKRHKLTGNELQIKPS